MIFVPPWLRFIRITVELVAPSVLFKMRLPHRRKFVNIPISDLHRGLSPFFATENRLHFFNNLVVIEEWQMIECSNFNRDIRNYEATYKNVFFLCKPFLSKTQQHSFFQM